MKTLLTLLSTLILGASLAMAQTHGQKPESDSDELLRERLDWFIKQRAYPLDKIPAGARLNALRQLQRLRASHLHQADDLSATQWTNFGPRGVNIEGAL